MSSWHSYCSIYNLGHKALERLFSNDIVVEEKIDGSQFNWGIHNGELRTRSKGREFHPDGPDKMFTLAVEQVKKIQPLLKEGYTYRAEYLQKPKHNSLAYDRTPTNNLMIFDIEIEDSTFLNPDDKRQEAERLGFECVPTLYRGEYKGSIEQIFNLLDTVSVLGGQKIEGVVIKNYEQFGPDKKVLMAKYVSEAFKEVHCKDWKERHPNRSDIVLMLQDRYKTPARWNKAVQHLRERGELTETPKDIGLLMKEVNQDVLKECEEEIKDILFKHFWKNISQGLTRGLPEWYKRELACHQAVNELTIEAQALGMYDDIKKEE